jgi:2-phosphoglycerate kinase
VTQPRRSDPLPLGQDGVPFSKGLMARALSTAGLSFLRAYELALRVEQDLRARQAESIDFERLHDLAVEMLGEADGARTVRRLRRYGELRLLEVPVIVLVGGATGTGKSTIATEVAHRLGITRVTSTDFVRQTMRAYFSPEFVPSVHYSSFEAGEGLPPAEREAGDPLLVGFLEQTRYVLVGIQAAIERALQEGWSMVLEGVHLVPGMLPVPHDRALVVQAVVAIENEDAHAEHFFIRDAASGGLRALDKYLQRLGDIRHLQDFIVDEAHKNGVPVVQNASLEPAIGEVLELVFARMEAFHSAAKEGVAT